MHKQQKKKKNAERKKKKKEKKKKWRCSSSKTRPSRDLGCRVTPAGTRPLFLFLGFFFFFYSLMNTYFLLLWFSFAVVVAVLFVFYFLFFILVVNQVLETWFSCRCHVEKCHIRREQSIKIESQKLDLYILNRVS